MSLTAILILGLIAWMLFMHLRPGGHGGHGGGGCGMGGGHGSHEASDTSQEGNESGARSTAGHC